MLPPASTLPAKFTTRSGLVLQRLAKKGAGGEPYFSKEWHLRIQHRGERRWIPLDRNPKSAEKKANDLVCFLDSSQGRSRSIADGLAELERAGLRAPRPLRVVTKVSTLGELRDVVELSATEFDVTEQTICEYMRSVFTIVRAVVLHRDNKNPSKADLWALPVSVLTPDLLKEYKRIKLPPGMVNHTTDSRRAKATANRHLRNLRAVFTPDRIDHLVSQNLILPSLGDLSKVSTFKRSEIKYELPIAEEMLALVRAIHVELPMRSQAMYAAALLALHGGLRRADIANAKWSWLKEESDGLKIHIQADQFYAPKFGKERKVRITRWLFDALTMLKQNAAVYILPEWDVDGNERLLRDLVVWLRAQGATAEKPVHELRKWFGSFMATEYDITKAQRQLGHSTPQITNDKYAGINFHPALRFVWLAPDRLKDPMPDLLAILHRSTNQVGDTERDALGFPIRRYI